MSRSSATRWAARRSPRCLARHGEDRVARAAFLSSTLPFLKQTEDNPQGMPQAAFDRLRAAVRADRPKWLARQTQLYFTTHLGSDVSPEQMDVTYRQCLSTAPWALLKAQEACFHADNRADLRGIGVPTLVVHGDADFSAPVERTGRRTAELLREVTYLEYPAAGHGIYVSHAQRFNADLLTFLEG
nr:alpha/beta hydrolase [Streptomyces sp. NBRC 110030]